MAIKKYSIMFIPVISISCGRNSVSNSDIEWTVAFNSLMAVSRGHEELLRFGVDFANDAIKQDAQNGVISHPFLFPEIPHKEIGGKTHNPMVKGNYSTDVGHPILYKYYNEHFNADYDVNHKDPFGYYWIKNQKLKFLHFERPFEEAPAPRWETCRTILNNLTQVARAGIDFLKKGDTENGYFYLGHATHTIQDSFSEGHTRRDPADPHKLIDMCIAGKDYPGLCKHPGSVGKGATVDFIYKENCVGKALSGTLDFACLKPLAQNAAKATGGFLYAVSKTISDVGTLEDNLQKFYLEDVPHELGGYLSCNLLP